MADVHAYIPRMSGRRFSDVVLFGFTLSELIVLVLLTPTFAPADWIYVLQHFLVLAIALTRAPPAVQDRSLLTSLAVGVSLAYPYAQVIYLRWVPGVSAWPMVGLVLVIVSACLSLASLLSLGRRFGLRPALRGLATSGPYRFVRHPMYLAYVLGDVGYNLLEWNFVTILIVIAGWASLLWRISAEERAVSHDARWPAYAALVRYRLLPGLW